jgi:outer membrane protein assembly factor BamB
LGVAAWSMVVTLQAANWPQFRGVDGASVGTGEPPIVFGPATNVAWHVATSQGNSSPVLWGDKIFLTGFANGRFVTTCLNKRGDRLWEQSVGPSKTVEPTHRLATPAAPTPVTDGEAVYCYFGSFGILAYDLNGHELWRRELPAPVVEFGTSASPILAAGWVILIRDQDDGSHLVALNPKNGDIAWKKDRPEFRRSFATPFVWKHDGVEELIVPGSIQLKSYNATNGTENWTVTGTSRVATSTPTAGGGMLFNASWNVGGDADSRVSMEPFATFAKAHDANADGKLVPDEIPDGPVKQRFTQMDLNKDGIVTEVEWEEMRRMFAQAGNSVMAIRPGGHGDVTATHLAWKTTRSLPYVSSPLFYQGHLYTMKNGGLASCYDPVTGKPFYQDERVGVGSDFYSSAVGAAGRIYITAQNGTVIVLEAGETFHVLARNNLGEEAFATPAIVDGTIYLRSANTLWAFRSPGTD